MAVPGRSEQIKWDVSNYAKKRIKTAQVSLSTLFQSLQRYFRDPGFDQNTVRDSGKRDIFWREAGFIKIWARDAGIFASLSGIREVLLTANANQIGERSAVSSLKANYRVILVMIIWFKLSSNQQTNGQTTPCFNLMPGKYPLQTVLAYQF